MITGTIQLNAQAMAQLLAYSTGSYGAVPYGTNPAYGATGTQCISNIAVDAIYTSYNTGYTGYTAAPSTGVINQAIVYVTLSTGQVVTLGFR